MKDKRRTFLKMLLTAFSLAAMCMLVRIPAKAVTFRNEVTSGKESTNQGRQNYEGNWSRPAQSSLYRNADGTYNRVEKIGKYIYAETYSASFQLRSQKKVKMELSLWGGVYTTEDYYYVLEGSKNKAKKANVTEFRIIKYDKKLKKVTSSDIKNSNTLEAFCAGGCRFAEDNGFLYIRTCHGMYNGHQASVMMKVHMADLNVIAVYSNVANTAYGYVSHSFNQFLAVRDGVIYASDHGDAYKRGINVFAFKDMVAGKSYFKNEDNVSFALPFAFANKEKGNYTGATLGGFAVSTTHALSVGSSIPQKEGKQYKIRNIYVAKVPIAGTENSTSVNWLTHYSQKSKWNVETPQMVAIHDNKYLIIWEENQKDSWKYEDCGRVGYCYMDGTGAAISKVKYIYANLSDCQPIVSGDSVVWYVTNNSKPVFYQLPVTSPLTNTRKKGDMFTQYGIRYKITKATKTGGKVTVVGYNRAALRKQVYIPNKATCIDKKYTVTAIGNKAFYKCSKMKELSIPKTVKVIGKKAFYGCSKLRYCVIEYKKYTTKSIQKDAFKKVRKNVNVVVPYKKYENQSYQKLLKKRGMKSTKFGWWA